jgi:hypothetical protein
MNAVLLTGMLAVVHLPALAGDGGEELRGHQPPSPSSAGSKHADTVNAVIHAHTGVLERHLHGPHVT